MDKKEIKLELIKEGDFLGIKCNFYKDEGNNVYMTRQQIGEALEYKVPDDAIRRMHNRKQNKDRLDRFSIKLDLIKKEGWRNVKRKTIFYNEKGILEIIKLSTQPITYKYNLLKSIGYSEKIINIILGTNTTTLSRQNEIGIILKLTYYDCDIENEVIFDNYRVDFLLNNYIVIECDENGHKDRDINYEKTRENFLKNKGLIVLRYNPDDGVKNNKENLIFQINKILGKNYIIKYPEKSFYDYDNDILVRIESAKRKWGGYIGNPDTFAKQFQHIFLNKNDYIDFKRMISEGKEKQEQELDKILYAQ